MTVPGTPGLVQAAIARFGAWDAALAAAGIDPGEVRLQHAPWSKAEVIARIRGRRRRGRPLNSMAVTKEDASLASVAWNVFGGWDEAVRAAGIEPSEVRLQRARWTEAEIVAEIRSRRRKGKPVNHAAVEREQNALVSVARKRFGAWDVALRAAGIDPDEVRLQRAGWTKALVVGEILSRRRKGGRLNRSAVQREQTALASAARAMFGGWDAALRAAGIDPATVRMRRKWTAEGMISAIRARQRAGKALTYAAAERDDAGLVGAAKPLFGSWDGALRAAGIRPKLVRGRPRS